jgi:hypothetical protein
MILLDVEASGLHPTSYPIEVAWCRHDLTAGWSTLIRPASDWGRDDWSPAAEAIHGITRAQVEIDGMDMAIAAATLNRDLADQDVLTDNPETDGRWLWRMFVAAGCVPSFDIVRPLLPGQTSRSVEEQAWIAGLDADNAIYQAAATARVSPSDLEQRANELRAAAGIINHRALDDAIGLALDLAAVAAMDLDREHGVAAAMRFQIGIIDRAKSLLEAHGRVA